MTVTSAFASDIACTVPHPKSLYKFQLQVIGRHLVPLSQLCRPTCARLLSHTSEAQVLRNTRWNSFIICAASDSSGVSTSSRLQSVLDGLDTLNSKDPRHVVVDGHQVPYELAYARWLSGWVAVLCAAGGVAASEELRIAARGQHVERWTVPRSSYPEGRSAYLQWREDLKRRHAATTARLMTEAGYPQDSCRRVEQLIMKRALKETEGQILEDALCLVFLERQFAEFLDKLSETPGSGADGSGGGNGGTTTTTTRDAAEAKIIDILQKSWRKMGPLGRAAAVQLPLEPRLAELVGRALAPAAPASSAPEASETREAV